jgi:uncharacterized OB-fold protein
MTRPAPTLTAESGFFWEGAARGELLIQSCDDCGMLCHPPSPLCPSCHSAARGTTVMSGRGRIASYAIIHHPPNPWFELPIAIVTIELDEGPRIISNICDVPFDEIRLGMEVEAFFEPTEDDLAVPLFRPVAA